MKYFFWNFLRCRFMALFSLLVIGGAVGLTAQEQAAPKKEVIIRGIVVSSSKECWIPAYALKEFSGVEVNGVRFGERLKETLLPFCDTLPFSNEAVRTIRSKIEECFRSNGYPFVLVSYPTQEISSGVVQLLVLESGLDQIQVSGNTWTSASLLKKQMGIESGSPINQNDVFRALNVMNRNPFHSVSAIYEPGSENMTTNIDLAVNDRRPIAFYFGADDTGIRYTGQPRFFAGASWGNAFFVNHIMTFQYTTSADFHEFQAFTLQYLAPLYNGNILNIYGGYSSVFPEISNLQTSHGYGIQGSLRYLVPFRVRETTSHEAECGFDFKRTNNVVQFVPIGIEPIAQGVNLTQFLIGYHFHWQTPVQMFSFRIEGVTSPGSFLPDQTNADYNDLRPGAKHLWFYAKSLVKWERKLPKECRLVCSAAGQYSANNLLPSEQFGLGGWDTVRGYRERQLNKESAIAATVEFHTPSYSLEGGWKDLIHGLIFFDFGWGMNRTAIGYWDRYDAIAGIGPGLRIQAKDYLRVRCDWGFRLAKIDHPHVDLGSFLHFSAVSTF